MTEPDIGSGANDMQTTCRKEGVRWYLNGKKKWIGNSTWCDISIVWAKDVDDGKIKGFIVDNSNPNFKVEKIENKFGLRVCQNGIITLNNVVIPEGNELKGVTYQDVLHKTRYLVACEATGLQIGAYEHTLKYAMERKQFGKPIASFQIVQDLLAKMLANCLACQSLCVVLGQQEKINDVQTSLAKAFCTLRARETVAWGREIFGANGLQIDYNIGRFFTDAEALYTYDGSYQMQNLIIGKNITGISAFS
jgi:glutaryl-CoA dehydrogenase